MNWNDDHFHLSMDFGTGLVQCQTLNGGIPIEHLRKIIFQLNRKYQQMLARPAPEPCIT